jgi:hypothetical protein
MMHAINNASPRIVPIPKAPVLPSRQAQELTQASELSEELVALRDLGAKYVAVTNDPKNPQPPSDQLIAELVVAFANALGAQTGWLLVGFPKTALQVT